MLSFIRCRCVLPPNVFSSESRENRWSGMSTVAVVSFARSISMAPSSVSNPERAEIVSGSRGSLSVAGCGKAYQSSIDG